MRLLRARWFVPIVFVLFVWTMTTHGKYSNSGDEPHYLTIAESLVSDWDLDLANNYGQTGHWFGANDLAPGPHAARNRRGDLWSVHDIGTAVVVLPVYAAATRLAAQAPEDVLERFRQSRGLFAYSLVSLSMAVMTALAIALLISALSRVANPNLARLVGIAVAFSPPVLSHAFLVFPEVPAFALTCAAVWMLCARGDEITRPKMIAMALALGLMPWLHRKFAFYSLGLALLIAQQHWAWMRTQSSTVRASLAAAVVLPQLGLHLWTIAAWGQLGGPQLLEGLPFTITGIQNGIVGLLFDRERGLLGYAPIYLLAPVCWTLQWRAHRRLLPVILLLFLPMAAYVVWWAGFCPAARYLVPLMPLIAMPAARALDHALVRRMATALAVFQAAITAYLWQYPRAFWPKELGTNVVLDAIPVIGPLYSYALPSIFTGDPAWRGWMWVIVLAALAFWLSARSTTSAERASRQASPRRRGE